MTTARPSDWHDSLTDRLLHSAGTAVLHLLGKAASRPFTSAMVLVMTTGTIMAGSNALYGQPGHHPAPLMTETAAVVAPRVEPVESRPEQQIPAPVPDSLGDASKLTPAPDPLTQATEAAAARKPETPDAADKAIGNQDVAELQAKLKELGYYEGTVDGYYGPNTANAIRAFETARDMAPKGAVTPDILEAVKNASRGAPQAAVQPSVSAPNPEPQKVALAELPSPASDTKSDAIGDLVMQASATPAPAPESMDRNLDTNVNPIVDRDLILTVQRGLFQLGFLNSEINGVYDEATARAIREFENYKSYRVTGEMSPALVDMLMETGALN